MGFPKFKLVKTYICLTMVQEPLNGLVMLSIEKEITEKIDYARVITTFIAKKARRLIFFA